MEDRSATHVLIDNRIPHLSVRSSDLIDGKEILTSHNYLCSRIEIISYCHGMNGLNLPHCEENTLAIREKLDALYCEGITSLLRRIFN